MKSFQGKQTIIIFSTLIALGILTIGDNDLYIFYKRLYDGVMVLILYLSVFILPLIPILMILSLIMWLRGDKPRGIQEMKIRKYIFATTVIMGIPIGMSLIASMNGFNMHL